MESAPPTCLLVARCANGDEGALAELYDLFGRAAYALALRIVRDASQAEDVVQEAFLDLWRGAARFDPAARGRPATCSRSSTAAPSTSCAASRRARSAGATSTTSPIAPARTTSPASLVASEQGESVRRALAGLPAAAARGARAGVLQRAQPERDRGAPGRAARYGEITHARRALASARAAGRGLPRMSTHSQIPDDVAALITAHALGALEPDQAALAEQHIAVERRLPPRLRGRAGDGSGARAGGRRQRAAGRPARAHRRRSAGRAPRGGAGASREAAAPPALAAGRLADAVDRLRRPRRRGGHRLRAGRGLAARFGQQRARPRAGARGTDRRARCARRADAAERRGRGRAAASSSRTAAPRS